VHGGTHRTTVEDVAFRIKEESPKSGPSPKGLPCGYGLPSRFRVSTDGRGPATVVGGGMG
jgi:hypothetical protein